MANEETKIVSPEDMIPQTEIEEMCSEKENTTEFSGDATVPHTDSENVSELAAGEPSGNEGAIASQSDEEPAPKPKRRRKKADSESQFDKETGISSEDAVSAEEKPKRKRTVKPKQNVMTIDDTRSVETDADKAQNDLIDLLESMKTGKILTGTIQGVEEPSETHSHTIAVIYHGSYKVMIPAEEAVNPPEDYRDQNPEDVHHYMLTKRLGAEVDYIVKGIDPESGLAVASRLEAMRAKRKQYYFGTDREGNNLLYGVSIEYLLGYDSFEMLSYTDKIPAESIRLFHGKPVWVPGKGWALVNAADNSVIYVDGCRDKIEDNVELYFAPPAYTEPAMRTDRPLLLDELYTQTEVWVEPISEDTKLKNALRGRYTVREEFVENTRGSRFHFDGYGAEWIAYRTK